MSNIENKNLKQLMSKKKNLKQLMENVKRYLNHWLKRSASIKIKFYSIGIWGRHI